MQLLLCFNPTELKKINSIAQQMIKHKSGKGQEEI